MGRHIEIEAPRVPIDRLTAADMMSLVSGASSGAMQVGAIVVLEPRPGFGPSAAEDAIADRIRAIPRLRQRLVPAPPGCGRPFWADDADFDVRGHIRRIACPPPGDEQALLDLAGAVVTDPLPNSRPLWAVTIVTGLADGKLALIAVFHHVLADGIGGLAILAGLTDGGPAAPPAAFPVPAPSRHALAIDAWAGRLRAFSHLPAALAQIGRALTELGGGPHRAPHTSLNRPADEARHLAVARTNLADIHATARARGATVNDAVLTAVTGALHNLLARRGEDADALVVSVPVSARAATTTSQLGNQAGVMPVALPGAGDPLLRIGQIGAITRRRKAAAPGASAAPLATAFRALAAVHLLRWFINHQRQVNTFVTNLRGPAQRLSVGGATVSAVIPVALIAGNVTVAFTVLSYAGTLTITVIADRRHAPDLPGLTAALQAELDALTAPQTLAQPSGR